MSVLVDYILTLYPQQEFVNSNVPAALQQCLISFINKQIPLDQAKAIIQSLNLSIDPLEKLDHILSIDSAPVSFNPSKLRQTFKLKKSVSQAHSTELNNANSKDSSISDSSDTDILQESENAEESENDLSDSKENSNSQSNRRKSHCWTSSEDERLLAGVHRYGIDNWSSVAHFVGNSRTRSQCSQRWFRGIDPRLSKNLWTREEDNMLMSLVSFYGDRSWTKIASKLGNRSDVQCRYHYKQIHKDFQNHAHAAANFFNNNSVRIKDTLQKQQDKQQNQCKQSQLHTPDQLSQYPYQNQQAQPPIQNQQPQFQLHNQQSQFQFQNQQQPMFQAQMQDHSMMNSMNMGQFSQMNKLNNSSNLNGMNSCFPMNRMQSQINYNQMQPNMNSIPNSFNGNPCFIPQQKPQIMNWPASTSIQQSSFSSFSNGNRFENCNQFSNNSQFCQFQTPVVGMSASMGTNPSCFQSMQPMQNQIKNRKSGPVGRPRKPKESPTEQIQNNNDQQLSVNQKEENKQVQNDTEANQFSSSDVIPKQSSSSSSNEPAIFELDDSDLFSKEAMALFSVPSEKDYLFF